MQNRIYVVVLIGPLHSLLFKNKSMRSFPVVRTETKGAEGKRDELIIRKMTQENKKLLMINSILSLYSKFSGYIRIFFVNFTNPSYRTFNKHVLE